MIDRAIPTKWRARIERELNEGESLLWCGRPRPVFLTKMATAYVLFGIPWTAVVFLWIFSCLEFPDAGNMPYYMGSFFAVVGIGIVLSPLWGYLVAMRTIYAITDQRVVLFNRYIPMVFSVPRGKIGGTLRTEYRDGTGDVVIKGFNRRASDGVMLKTEYELQRIKAPASVEKIIRTLYRRQTGDEASRSRTNVQKEFSFDDDISPPLREALEGELEAGEFVVWATKPKPKRLSVETHSELFTGIALSVLFGGATLIAVCSWPTFQKASDFWKLFPGVFALAGIAITVQPIWAHWRILKSAYFITNRRAIIITGGRNTTFLSLTPDEFSGMEQKNHSDGTSDLVLVKEVSHHSDSDTTEELGLLRINNIGEARNALSVIERMEEIGEAVVGVS